MSRICNNRRYFATSNEKQTHRSAGCHFGLTDGVDSKGGARSGNSPIGYAGNSANDSDRARSHVDRGEAWRRIF